MASGLYSLEGASVVIENLAEELNKRGVETTVGAFKFRRRPPNGYYKINQIPFPNLLKLKRFLGAFDFIHSHHAVTNYLSLVYKKHFIYHYHGAPNFGRGNLLRCNMFLSIKLMNDNFDAVIAVSESAAAELSQYFGFNNVHVIYNGVNTERFRLGLEDKFRKGEPQFLFVGNLYKHKKVEELLAVMKYVIQSFPKAYLQIIGKGQMYDKLKLIIKYLQLEDHVELVGRVDRCELPNYYASCDVYVTASRWELFGLPLLEAMACGRPVVASAIPPHVEILTKAKAGITYTKGNVEDLCKKMIETYENSKKYSLFATHFARKHDWALVANRLIRLYKNLLSNDAC